MIKELKKFADPQKAKVLQGFFKTGKGEYGEGDIFIGVRVPEVRSVAKKHADARYPEIRKLLQSRIHEERLLGFLILVEKFDDEPDKVYKFYMDNCRRANNWDLVDLTCHEIAGRYLVERDRKILYQLAKSDNLWERRIAIVSTYAFIRKNQLDDTFRISEILLEDEQDLIRKAVGWMLREAGKRNQAALEKFLKRHCKKMPRVMLRYAIEKFDPEKRKSYMR